MELKEKLLNLLNTDFDKNRQTFIISIINSKKFVQLKAEITSATSFLENSTFSQRIFHIFLNSYEIPKCYCGDDLKFFDLSKGYNLYCSPKCRYSSIEMRGKRERTNLERFGTKIPSKNQEIKNKTKRTNLEKYGFESHNSSEDIKEKKKKVCLEKYGVENVSQVKEVQEKREDTFMKRFGVKNPNMNEGIKKKKKEYFLEKFGVEWFTQNREIRDRQRRTLQKNVFNRLIKSKKINERVKFLFTEADFLDTEKDYPFICLKCTKYFLGSFSHGQIPRCLNCYPLSKGFSLIEKEIVSWLKNELNIQNIIENSRKIIENCSIDIYLPNYKLAIEFNGLYWHSEIGNNKDRKYHINKTEKCLEKGIQLLHIFEDEWINKQDMIKSLIKHKIGLSSKIYARNTIFKEISKKKCESFFEENHFQGYNSRITNSFGLFNNEDLLFVIGIGKPRYNKKYDFELIRSCSKLNTVVVGGFDKLIKNLPLKGYIISYVDCRYFTGSGYKNWMQVGFSESNYFYMKDYKYREYRTNYMKHKLQKLFPNTFDEGLTEWENMQLAGYDRIWDCGNLVFSRQL